MIPYGKQWIDQDDIDAVVETLTSSYLTQGPRVPELEQFIAKYTQARFVTLMNSATSALHIACLALGVNSESKVWTSPISFVASANCARYCGAEVDFVDVDLATGNLSVNALESKLIEAKAVGCLPDVVIPVHYAGNSCEMAKIGELSQQYGFRVIEDASHALGGQYKTEPVGNCRYSDIAIFSFHPVKMITTGEGGCLCTNDPMIEKATKLLMNHGITKNTVEFVNNQSEPWRYEQQQLGFNFRMTEIQASLGLSQFPKLDSWVEKRNALMQRYTKETQHLPLEWLNVAEDVLCSFHLAVIRVSPQVRLQLFEFMQKNGVGVQVHYIPIYQQPYYGEDGSQWPNAELFYSQILSLPLFPKMTEHEQSEVISLLEEFFL